MFKYLKTFIMMFFFVILSTGSIINADDFRLVEQWRHEGCILAEVQELTVDQQGNLVGGFASRRKSKFVISKDKMVEFARHGKGPSDLINLDAIFPYKGDLAIAEIHGKVKIFTKKDDTYVWKATKWFRRGYNMQFVRDGFFYNDKWFFAGYTGIYKNRKRPGKEYSVFYLKVFDNNGKLLKGLLYEKMIERKLAHFMKCHIAVYKDRLFFMKENELKVRIVSLGDLEEQKPVTLEMPSFYKPLPDDFYQFSEKYRNNFQLLEMSLEHWETGYGQVTKMVVDKDYLVVQIRTCSDRLKKFALLFYNASNFKLERTVFIDDYLVASKNGKFYFIAGGNPSLDEDIDDCIINIYSFKEKR